VWKNCTKNWTECSLAQHRFPIRFVSFFVSSVCLLVRETMVDKNKAVICCLLATPVIMLSEKKKRKRKMWSKKCYLKSNISCDVHLLNALIETRCALRWCHRDVGRWTEETVVFPEWTSQFFVWKTTGKTVLRPALLPVKTAQFTQFFRQVWRHTVNLLSLTESV
jgi:hypothetical protein